MRILIASDAWDPQANGVVATLPNTVPGPLDVVVPGVSGILNGEPGSSALEAIELDRARVWQAALSDFWTHATAQFLGTLHPDRAAARAA
jgi:hypothetical protein